jgi:hypothetical protein
MEGVRQGVGMQSRYAGNSSTTGGEGSAHVGFSVND